MGSASLPSVLATLCPHYPLSLLPSVLATLCPRYPLSSLPSAPLSLPSATPSLPSVLVFTPSLKMASDWSKGMFDCMSSFTTCLYGSCCGLCMVYETAEGLQESGILYCLLACCITPCVPVMMLRMNAREKYNIEGSTSDDAIMACCCNCCTAIQVYQEVKARGGMQ